jgi:hypothetical protein
LGIWKPESFFFNLKIISENKQHSSLIIYIYISLFNHPYLIHRQNFRAELSGKWPAWRRPSWQGRLRKFAWAECRGKRAFWLAMELLCLWHECLGLLAGLERWGTVGKLLKWKSLSQLKLCLKIKNQRHAVIKESLYSNNLNYSLLFLNDNWSIYSGVVKVTLSYTRYKKDIKNQSLYKIKIQIYQLVVIKFILDQHN